MFSLNPIRVVSLLSREDGVDLSDKDIESIALFRHRLNQYVENRKAFFPFTTSVQQEENAKLKSFDNAVEAVLMDHFTPEPIREKYAEKLQAASQRISIFAERIEDVLKPANFAKETKIKDLVAEFSRENNLSSLTEDETELFKTLVADREAQNRDWTKDLKFAIEFFTQHGESPKEEEVSAYEFEKAFAIKRKSGMTNIHGLSIIEEEVKKQVRFFVALKKVLIEA